MAERDNSGLQQAVPAPTPAHTPTPAAGGWERLRTDDVADYGVFGVSRHRMRSPRTGNDRDFYVVRVPLCVHVLPFTTSGDVILVEQFRPGVQRMSLEFPAGVVEDGEDAVAAAVRELEEETGYRAESAEVIGDIDPDPAIQTNQIRIIVARGCCPDGDRCQDEGEDVKVRVASPSEVDQLIARGGIRHAAAISAWHLYSQSRSGLSGSGKSHIQTA